MNSTSNKQSGGSTPKALNAYGTPDDDYVEGEESMYNAVHTMRSRIITANTFTGDKILGAILFENTMDRQVEGIPTSQYLWEKKQVIPFLKIDKGLAAEKDGVQVMKPMPALDELLKRAKAAGIFGKKMRSNINSANEDGIKTATTEAGNPSSTTLCTMLNRSLEWAVAPLVISMTRAFHCRSPSAVSSNRRPSLSYC